MRQREISGYGRAAIGAGAENLHTRIPRGRSFSYERRRILGAVIHDEDLDSGFSLLLSRPYGCFQIMRHIVGGDDYRGSWVHHSVAPLSTRSKLVAVASFHRYHAVSLSHRNP